MSQIVRTLCLFVALALVGQGAVTQDKYAKTLSAFQAAAGTAPFFNNAYGYALFPTIGKGGIGIGGAHGGGQVYVGGRHVGNTTMTQLTMGFQLGGQAFSQIVFFEDQRAYREFTTGNFEFSAQATAVALTAGVSAEANTGGGLAAGASGGQNDASTYNSGYRKGMAIFTIAKGGLMYEAALGGQKFTYTPL